MCRKATSARLHGHSFRVELHLTGELGAESGWVMDFGDVKTVFQPKRAVPATVSIAA
jgi:6-pyruvoyl-tetrahydropterin synthase